jgi:hypothetical protein
MRAARSDHDGGQFPNFFGVQFSDSNVAIRSEQVDVGDVAICQPESLWGVTLIAGGIAGPENERQEVGRSLTESSRQ